MNTKTKDINTIASRFFQPALSRHALDPSSVYFNDRLGMLVSDFDDINQAIEIILTTMPGSNPHRPLFGCALDRYLDYPINSARPHLVREIIHALRAWEPRIEVVRVTVDLIETTQLHCTIEWKLANSSINQIFTSQLRF